MATNSVLPIQHIENPAAGSTLARRFDIVGSSALFKDVPDAEVMQATLCARSRVFDRNESLFLQGDAARHLFLLDYGSVKLTEIGANGTEVILSLCGSHHTLGVSVLLARNNYRCSARAVAKCRALIWDRTVLEPMLRSSDPIHRNVDNILLERIQELEDRFIEIATENVERRVALALLRVLRHMGRKTLTGIEVALSREEIAQLTGTTLFSVSRLISKWYAQGLVQPKRQAVLILDPKRLSATCHA